MATQPADAALPPAPEPIDFVRRWEQIVERRRAQMDGAYAAAGVSNVDYWARRAKNYREALHSRTDEDPFFLRVRNAVTPENTLIDVGAGTGRHTLALAPHVRHVTAVDPSEAMLSFLQKDVTDAGFSNVDIVVGDWIAAGVEPADFVICSHVLYPISDVVPFVRKLEQHARERVYVYLRADPLPTEMGLWREFYGVPLQDQPVHTDLLGVLAQLGVFPDVEVVEHRFTFTFVTMDDAVAQVRNSLCLREDDAAATAKLRALLDERLERRPDGRLGPRVGSARSAIISWRPAPAT